MPAAALAPLTPAAPPAPTATGHGSASPVATFLERVHERHRDRTDGTVATYIPALAAADSSWFGVALMTVDGTGYDVGDSRQPFTIQSISKPFTYGLVLDALGEPEVRRRIGVEPTGDAFNSITLAPGSGIPLNPMVNAGAITAAAMVAMIPGVDPLSHVVERFSAAAGRRLGIDDAVHRSERDTGHRNRAIGHLLRASRALDDDPEAALDRYFAQCSITVDAVALATMAATLANGGVNPVSGERVLAAGTVRSVLSVMATCGMYDAAGEWLYTVGLPAKSGVAGGVLAVVPGELGIAIFSPPLDAQGNSVRGVEVCRDLVRELDLHLLGRGPASVPPLRARHTVGRLGSKRGRTPSERTVIARGAWQAEVRQLQGDLTFLAAERAIRGLEDPTGGPRWVALDLGRTTDIEPGAIGLLADLVVAMRADGRDLAVASGSAHLEALDALDARLAATGQPVVRRFPDGDRAREWGEESILDDAAASSPGLPDHDPLSDDEALFGGLSAAERTALQHRFERRLYAPGSVVVRRGDEATELFLVVSGRLSVTVDRPDGISRRLTTLSGGMVFGELAFVARDRRTADVHADTMVECLVLEAGAFEALLADEPHIAAVILSNLLRIVGGTARRLTDELAVAVD